MKPTAAVLQLAIFLYAANAHQRNDPATPRRHNRHSLHEESARDRGRQPSLQSRREQVGWAGVKGIANPASAGAVGAESGGEVLRGNLKRKRTLLDSAGAANDSGPPGSPILEVPLSTSSDDLSTDGEPSPRVPETALIQPIDIPFLQGPDDWQIPGNGISLDATGEPKSGTSWLGRLIPQLALELCGNSNNSWCEMGGLTVIPNIPAPKYIFEMTTKTESENGTVSELFLHFDGNNKHLIPGMSGHAHPGCDNGGRAHFNYFGEYAPCLTDDPPTRELLRGCLWKTSALCVQYMPSVDPDVRRSIIILRDPRDVVISERGFRLEYYDDPVWMAQTSADEFVRRRFEIIVSWVHQRYVWHTESVMAPSSHIVYYDDLKDNYRGLIDMAAFMGLNCSDDDAQRVWWSHRNAEPHGDYTTHGLEDETIVWMNATMARLLPPALAARWAITPTDL
ncbi:unnamed protein product [Scytosiphon promiscuus]